MRSRESRVVQSGTRRLLLFVFVSIAAVLPLHAQSDTEFDSYKVRISGFLFYSNPSGSITASNASDTIDLPEGPGVQRVQYVHREAGLEIHS